MSLFLKNTPFFRLSLALAVGILAAIYNIPIWAEYVVFTIGLSSFILFCLIRNKSFWFRYNWLFGLAVFCILINIGTFLTKTQLNQAQFPLLNQQGIFTVKIIEQPIEKQKSAMCRVQVIEFCNSTQNKTLNSKAILYIEKDSLSLSLQRGDILLTHCRFVEPQQNNNPFSFNYKEYLKRKGIGATAYCRANSWQRLTNEPDKSLFAIAEKFRTYLLNIYKQAGIDGDEFGMLAALTLGYKDALSPELRESFSTTGAMHVLAVSGLHVGILFMILGFILKPLSKGKKNKILKNIIIILFLWLYAFITGLSPSVCRATLMFSLVAFATILNRQSSIYNTIFLSAFVLLLIKPTYLVDVGFQLSYCAVIAIVYFQPRLSSLWKPRNFIVKWCWELTCVSLVAQIGTAPFAMYYFHQFPNYFLLSNFIVIPAASIIIYLAIALFLTSSIPYIGMAMAFVLNLVLKLLYQGISSIEHLPNALSTLWISQQETLLLYAIVIALIFLCEKRSFYSMLTVLLLTLSFFSIRLYRHYNDFVQQEVVIFEHNKSNIVNFVSGLENIVVTNDNVGAEITAEIFWLKKRIPKPTFIADSTLHSTAFVCNNKRYLCLTQSIPRKIKITPPIEIDHLIVGRKLFVDSTLFSNSFRLQQIDISQCVPYYTAKHIKNYAKKQNISCFGKSK